MERNGIDQPAQEQIMAAITSFAQYGFPESHAISFAMLSYASSYLKAHHPAVFYATLLNAWPMGFYHPATLVKDAQRHGVRVRPVEVNSSQWRCTIEQVAEQAAPEGEHAPRRPSAAFRIGLRFVRGLSQTAAQALVQARADGPYRSIGDLQRRCPQLGAAELTTLAEIGAFASLAEKPTRRDALWQVSELVKSRGGLLAGTCDTNSPLPAMSLAERIEADYAGTSLTVGPHPIALCREPLRAHGVRTARELAAAPHGQLVRTAGLVIVRQRPATARGFFFMTLEDESGLVNLIIAPPVFEQYRAVLLSASGLFADGQLQRERDSVSIKGLRFRDLADLLQTRAA
jgi:error-prone DNA polymerase